MKNSIKLPAPIQGFIDASNTFDSEALISNFADDAMVNDIMRNFWGKDAIKQFSDKEIIGDKVTMMVNEAKEHYGDYILTVLLDGKYDKTKAPGPLYLDLFFTLRNDKIVKLIMIKNTLKSENA